MRKQKHPTRWIWGRRRGRPWTDAEIERALTLRKLGATDEVIADVLNRTPAAIYGKIGYVPAQRRHLPWMGWAAE